MQAKGFKKGQLISYIKQADKSYHGKDLSVHSKKQLLKIKSALDKRTQIVKATVKEIGRLLSPHNKGKKDVV